MIQFPDNAIVNIHSGVFLKGKFFVSIRIGENVNNISMLKKTYAKRIFNFDINSNLCDNAELLHAMEGFRVRIYSSSNDLSAIGKNVNIFKRLYPIFVINPDNNSMKKINFLTAFKFPVYINTSVQPETNDILDRILDYYLHNPLLTVPIDPFHSLLKMASVKKNTEFNLWDIEMEKININFYLSDSGKITLSSRWDKNGLYYCELKDSFKDIVSSELFNNLLSYKKMLFQKKSSCAFCQHFNLCGGFLKAACPNLSCENWRKIFSALNDEIKNAMSILKNYNENRT
ncbi:hypothetical protein HZA55_04555 [Candidatus Poribacteria bacterium]|nr:hypothetical protein [Candidatus Poribacteria bacterium]